MESVEMSTKYISPITETKTICLSDNIARVIFEQISIFYRENELFDTVIMAGNKGDKDHVSFSAHRMVLSALSQYFREAYRDAQTVLTKNVLEFPQIHPQTLKSIVDFMYSGTIELDVDTVEGILSAAIFLKINILIECCCEFIESNINPSNCILFFRVSRPWPEERSFCGLKEKSMEFIYLNFDELSKEDEFLMLTEKEIKDLLSYESRHSDIEEAVFMSILAWINHDKQNREHLIVELLQMIHYQFLSIKFITEHMSISKSIECFELFSGWLKYHVSPETRTEDQKHLEVSMKNQLQCPELDLQTLKFLNELNIEIVEGILRASVFRKLKQLIEVCCEFVQGNINTSNYMSWFRLSTELSLSQIKEKSLDVIYMNFEQMSKDKEFLMLTEKEIKSLLSYKNPYTDFEEEVFKAVVAWVNYDKPSREHLTGDLLKMIRFQYLSTEFKADNNSLITDWRKYTSPETTDQADTFFKSRFGGLLFVNIEESNTIAIHMYDHKTEAWHKKIQTPFKKYIYHFSTLVINNKLFVVGGSDKYGHEREDIECFDLYTLKWISRSHMHYNRQDCQLSELDGQLCIYGGYSEGYIEFRNEIELYNPTTGEIIELCPPYRSASNKMSTCKGVLYLIDLKEGVLQFYDSRTQNWTHIQIPGQSVYYCVGFAAHGKYLYFPDGCSDKGVKRYDLKKRAWKEDSLKEPEIYQYIKTMILNNKIVIYRYLRSCGTIKFEEYDPNTNTWRQLEDLLIIECDKFRSCSMGSYTA